MTANVGRTIIVRWGDASPIPAVAGIREKSVTVSGEPVDITNDDSAGWRQLLDAPQMNTVEISASGVALNDTLRTAWFAGAAIASGTRMAPAEFEYPLEGAQTVPALIAGTFYLQEYSETGNHDGEITFEATWVSNGVVTYTPGS
jgi:TP901-1 family phage major tail protein